jgi:Dna[CI] antecedent, DciA
MDRLETAIRRELGRFGSGHGDRGDGDIVAIVRAWPEAVGETVARNAWPARLARDGTLHVNTLSSTWAFELGRLAETILEGLRQELGEATPPALKFSPGPVPESGAEELGTATAEASGVAPEHRAEGVRLAAGIEDDELRELVARAAAASLARAVDRPPSDRSF